MAVRVLEARALAARHKERRGADRFERPHRAVDAAGQDARRRGEQPRRVRGALRAHHFLVIAGATASEACAISGVSRSSPSDFALALSVFCGTMVAPSAVVSL